MASRQNRLTPIARSPSQSISRTGSQKSLVSGTGSGSGKGSGSEPVKDTIGGFKPLNVLIFKNGDEYDPGLEMSVTRKQYQNWLNLLDYLTDRLKLTEGAVHKIYAYPSGEEVRHFTEMENSGRFFVAAHAKYKKLKYGKHPRLANFKTSQNVKSPRLDPPSLNSKDSLQYYLKTHGFKQKLGDIWQDTDFNLKKKRPDAFGNEKSFTQNNEFEKQEDASEEMFNAPERSKSDFGVSSLRNEETSFEPQNGYGGEPEEKFQSYGEENNPLRSYSGKQSLFNDRQFPPKSMSEFGVRSEVQYDQRPSAVSPIYGSRPRSTSEQRLSAVDRIKTTAVIKKRNIKLQTEQNTEEDNPKSSSFGGQNFASSDMSVSTDEARYELLKKEKTYISGYWKDKEDRSKRLKQKPPPTMKARSSRYGSSNNRERESRLQKNVPVKRSNLKLAKNEPEKSPRWAEDLVMAVRSLTDRVDQLSARSRKDDETANGIFGDDED